MFRHSRHWAWKSRVLLVLLLPTIVSTAAAERTGENNLIRAPAAVPSREQRKRNRRGMLHNNGSYGEEGEYYMDDEVDEEEDDDDDVLDEVDSDNEIIREQPRSTDRRRVNRNVEKTAGGNQPQDSGGDFLEWCRKSLGVETILEVQSFPYRDFTADMARKVSLAPEWDDDQDDVSVEKDDGESMVRGLAATRHISAGEVVIRIPLHSLLSVTTTVDQDPILSPLLGPEARAKFGWSLTPPPPGEASEDDDPNLYFFYELSLLAVALLFHRDMGAESPLANYISVLEKATVDQIPFLWSKSRFDASILVRYEGIRNVATGIRQDMRDMYQMVVTVLADENPDVFGKKPGQDEDTWTYSYAHFQWAFAMVNTRHWHLPIDGLDFKFNEDAATNFKAPTAPKSALAVEDPAVPPADTPTSEWVSEQEETDDDLDETGTIGDRAVADRVNIEKDREGALPETHSFLAPVADLLNFGPPCTRGRYNKENESFEIVASCSFRKGQEVTFWYSDECDEVIVGMYGFTHPMIPACDYRSAATEWKQKATRSEEKASTFERRIKHSMEDLVYAETVLQMCAGNCDEAKTYTREDSEEEEYDELEDYSKHQMVRGGNSEVERHGVRRIRRQNRKSEF